MTNHFTQASRMPDIMNRVGRVLLAALFAAGAIQKWVDPQPAQDLLAARGLPTLLIWPAFAFNAMGAACLVFGFWLAPMTALLALYCATTSLFHYIPDDPWQMSIFVKNWAIAGGLLCLCSAELRHPSR